MPICLALTVLYAIDISLKMFPWADARLLQQNLCKKMMVSSIRES
jgi:hypothetical protein